MSQTGPPSGAVWPFLTSHFRNSSACSYRSGQIPVAQTSTGRSAFDRSERTVQTEASASAMTTIRNSFLMGYSFRRMSNVVFLPKNR